MFHLTFHKNGSNKFLTEGATLKQGHFIAKSTQKFRIKFRISTSQKSPMELNREFGEYVNIMMYTLEQIVVNLEPMEHEMLQVLRRIEMTMKKLDDSIPSSGEIMFGVKIPPFEVHIFWMAFCKFLVFIFSDVQA